MSGEQSRRLIRCDPSDGLNGFFVALFVRVNDEPLNNNNNNIKESGENNGRRNSGNHNINKKVHNPSQWIDNISNKTWKTLGTGKFF